MLNSITKKCCRQHVANCCLGVRPPLYWRAKPRNQILKKKEVVGRVAGENEEGRLSSKPILPNIKKNREKQGVQVHQRARHPLIRIGQFIMFAPSILKKTYPRLILIILELVTTPPPTRLRLRFFCSFPSITARLW
jgi:hypothetical protein